MGLRMAGTGAPVNTDSIKRWLEIRVVPQYTVDGNPEAGPLTGVVRFGGGASFAQPAVVVGPAIGQTPIGKTVDQRRCFKFVPTVALNSLLVASFNTGAGGLSALVDFQPTPLVTIPSFAAPDGADYRDPAWNVSAWIRKDAAGDASHCQHVMGFANTAVTGGATAEIPRVGLVGDGVLGYRFGSVNCPDGAAAGNNAASDIDANSVQPSDLVNPGTNWFHARVKMIPPGPGQVGQVACYLNGARVALFSSLANLPRGHQAVNDNFFRINAVVGTYFDAGGVRPSPDYHDLRFRIEDDWSV
jgi:hypothetical protein